MILGVHHPALSVPDMEKALAFYRDKLGFESVMSAEMPSGVPFLNEAFGVPDAGCKVAILKRGNSCIKLFEFEATDTPTGDKARPVNQHGITHICLAAVDYAVGAMAVTGNDTRVTLTAAVGVALSAVEKTVAAMSGARVAAVVALSATIDIGLAAVDHRVRAVAGTWITVDFDREQHLEVRRRVARDHGHVARGLSG